MKKTVLIFLLIVFFTITEDAGAQLAPLKIWKGNDASPIVLYLSGDGGFNSFSTDLCGRINKAGYAVAALNSKSYFWNKRTPEKTASDLADYLSGVLKGRANQRVVLMGYSFGADVIPFIINRLGTVKGRLQSVVLLAPSTSTDFEIHVADMWGKAAKRGWDVVAEINKISGVKTTIVLAANDKDFPVKSVTASAVRITVLSGGHHFDGDIDALSKMILNHF